MHGACGTVRLARHRASGKTIALKNVNLTDQGQRHQVLNELHVLCALNDEHIVPLHDAFYLDGNVYLALGYCNGGSLDDLLGAYQALASSAAAQALGDAKKRQTAADEQEHAQGRTKAIAAAALPSCARSFAAGPGVVGSAARRGAARAETAAACALSPCAAGCVCDSCQP